MVIEIGSAAGGVKQRKHFATQSIQEFQTLCMKIVEFLTHVYEFC